MDSFYATGEAYGEYILNYLYYEEPLTDEEISLYEETEQDHSHQNKGIISLCRKTFL